MMHAPVLEAVWVSAHARNPVICYGFPKCLIALVVLYCKIEHIVAFMAIFSNINVKKTEQFKHGVRNQITRRKLQKIILKLSVFVFWNILLKTVILNYSTIWLLTPTLSKTRL